MNNKFYPKIHISVISPAKRRLSDNFYGIPSAKKHNFCIEFKLKCINKHVKSLKSLKNQSIRDYPEKKFWKSDDFWATNMLLKKKPVDTGTQCSMVQGGTANFAGWFFLEFLPHASRYESENWHR